MNYKIIDNALPQEEFEKIKNNIFNYHFPWNLTTFIHLRRSSPNTCFFLLYSLFWDGNIEPASQMFAPLLNLMDCHALMRVKQIVIHLHQIIVHDNHLIIISPWCNFLSEY